MRDLKQRLFDLLRSGGISVGDNNSNNNGNNNGNSNGNSVAQHHHLQQHQQQQQQLLYSPLHAQQKPKKLHEYTAADCNAAFLRKYHDLSISREREKERERDEERLREANGAGNVIYFNENLSMTSKYNVRQYPLTRYPSCPLSSFGMSPPHADGSAGSSLAEDTESDRYNFCSDEDQSSNAHTLKLHHRSNSNNIPCLAMNGDGDGVVNGIVNGVVDVDMVMSMADVDAEVDLDDDQAESQLDSFCTLCTSTFSYNKCCRYCDNSLCGSKCNSERGSHASRISCNTNPYGGLDGDFDCGNQLQQQQQQHLQLQQQQQLQQRFGGSMKMLTTHGQHKVAPPAAIR